MPRRLKPWWRARQVKLAHRRTTPEGDASSAPFGWIYSPAVTETAGFFLFFSRLQAPAAVAAG
ncbi:hypothetical protein HMPREF3036_00072 [Sutterella sp. KLE1602]|nr:hypothetical protein HMPREF3036_00072 [Sutterella sp. KLE1602]